MNISLQDVRAAFDGFSSEHMYIGDIPRQIYANACAGMGIEPRHRGEVLAVYDACAFLKHGDEGFVIVHDGIYIRKMLANWSFKKWDDISSISKDAETPGDILVDDAVFFAFADDVDNVVNCLQRLVEMAKGGGFVFAEKKDTEQISASAVSVRVTSEKENQMENRLHVFCEDAPCANEEVKPLVIKTNEVLWGGRTVVSKDDDGVGRTRWTWYIIPTDENTALLLFNLGPCEWLDNFKENLDEYNFNGVVKAWPRLIAALKNGCDDNYSHQEVPALIRTSNPLLSGESIWAIVVKVENIDFEDLDTKYILGKVGMCLKFIGEMFQELRENDVAIKDKLFGSARRGFDIWRTARMMGKAAMCVLPMFGMDFGGGDE